MAPDPPPQTGSGPHDEPTLIDLWHGTTLAAAERITLEGFTQPDLASEQAEAADAAGLSVEQLLPYLTYTRTPEREQLWFTSYRDAAEQWAQNAPEHHAELVTAAWFARHHDQWTGREPVQQGLIDEQLVATQRAVVRVRLDLPTFDTLSVPWENAVDPRDAVAWQEAIEHGFPVEIPLRAGVGPQHIVEVLEVPRRVTAHLVAHLLGLSWEEFRRRRAAGEFGEPDGRWVSAGFADWYDYLRVQEWAAQRGLES